MKTPFSSVILPPFPQPVLQSPRGCLFVSNIEKGGRGATFHDGRGENSHQGKKSWSLSCVSTTSVHDCLNWMLLRKMGILSVCTSSTQCPVNPAYSTSTLFLESTRHAQQGEIMTS